MSVSLLPRIGIWKQKSRRVGFVKNLYYRINVLTIQIPPLRERPGDVALLVERLAGPEWSIDPDVIPYWSDTVGPGMCDN